MRIAIQNHRLDGRGTGRSCYDYALGLLRRGHSVIFVASKVCENIAATKLEALGSVVLYDGAEGCVTREEIERIVERHDIDFMHLISYGLNENIAPRNCRTGIQCVFDMSQPHGDVYAGVSNYLANKFSRNVVVPPIVSICAPTGTIREKYGIPKNACVFGRHGGRQEFNLPFVHKAVEHVLHQRKDVYFLFLSTDKFIDHERAIFIPWVESDQDVSNFINSCDAMLHGRRMGETFGSAIGEFSLLGKKVLTWDGGSETALYDTAHLEHLGDAALVYSESSVRNDLLSFDRTYSASGLDRYSARFNERNVIDIFERIFLDAKPPRVKVKPKVFDCFTFWRELDVLELRLNTLDSVVDHFVLVESTKTHAGKDKQLVFNENKLRFKKFLHKILHVIVDDMPESEDRWVREHFQRDAIMRGLSEANNNDIIMISDVDEIPRPVCVGKFNCTFKQSMYNYYYNLKNTVEDWTGTVAVKYGDLKKTSPQALRDDKWQGRLHKVENGGWHFSWIGDGKAAKDKIEAFAHAEYDNEETKSKVAERIKNRIDFAARSQQKFVVEPLTEPAFPKYLVDNQSKFKHIIAPTPVKRVEGAPLKIHVYTIAKNEEQFCERWATSAKLADGLHVLDTGSTDNTVAVLKELGVNVQRTSFDSWKTLDEYKAIVARDGNPWRFDVPRNQNIDMIPLDADICLQVDMDEVLVPNWREIVEKNWKRDTTHLDYLYAWSMDGDRPVHMFHYNKCHTRHGYKWVKPVHEVITPEKDFRETFASCGQLLVKHYPVNKPRTSYLPLLQLSCLEDPTDTMNSFNLAREYTFYSMWNEAIAEVKRYLALPNATWPLERATACLLAAKSFGELKNAEQQEKWLLRAVSEDVKARESWCGLAEYYRVSGNNLGGFFCAKKALEITNHPQTHHNTVEAWREQPHDIASICGWYAGAKEESVKHAWAALKAHPFDNRLMDNYELVTKLSQLPIKTAGKPLVDVVILAWSKTAEQYKMAQRCIENLRMCSFGIPLNIVVVETNKELQNESFATTPLFAEEVTVIQPDEPFGYNRYLQIAYEKLKYSPATSLMILNNDVLLFSRGFMAMMLSHLAVFSSVSPLGLREAKWGRIDERHNIHPGYDLSVINGWCLLFDKALLKCIPFNELFPAELVFHNQDVFYAEMLKMCGFRHALVCDAQALHLQAQSGSLMDDEQKKLFTAGQQEVYDRLISAERAKRG